MQRAKPRVLSFSNVRRTAIKELPGMARWTGLPGSCQQYRCARCHQRPEEVDPVIIQ
jgi:hypothetical protein